jgi:hypothetical protein
MKKIVPAFFLLTLVFVFAPSATAAIQVPILEPGDTCGSIDPDTACYSGSGGAQFCSDPYGCPICALDMDNRPICSRLRGQNGKCNCKPKTVVWNEYGPNPICEQSGSCVQNRG